MEAIRILVIDGPFVLTPEWVQAGAAIAMLLAVVAFGLVSRGTLTGLAKKEESYRVQPILYFDYVEMSQFDTILMDVANIGRGNAFDVSVKVHLTRIDSITGKYEKYPTKYSPPTPIRYDRIPVDPSGTGHRFDTGIPKKHLSPTNPADLLVVGTVTDENNETLKIHQIRRFASFGRKVPEWSEG